MCLASSFCKQNNRRVWNRVGDILYCFGNVLPAYSLCFHTSKTVSVMLTRIEFQAGMSELDIVIKSSIFSDIPSREQIVDMAIFFGMVLFA